MEKTRLILISDTHQTNGFDLPAELLAAIQSADMIIHAGDIASMDAYERLKAMKPMVAAKGNMDQFPVKRILPDLASVEVHGHKIGVVHGTGSRRGIVDRVAQAVDGMGFEMVVFGHSHYPEIVGRSGTLFVNPGSPVDSRFAPYTSYAIVEVTPEGIGSPEIIQV